MIFTKPSNLDGFFGALRYVEVKRQGDLVAGNVGAVDFRGRYRELEAIAALKPGISEPGRHFVISADPGDVLTREQWAEIAQSTMKALGYEQAPWIAYRHHHGKHEHVHLIAARVRYDGRLVPDSFEVDRGQRHMRVLERAYGLRVLEPPEQRRRQETPKQGREAPPPEGLREILDGATARPQNFGSYATALAEQGVEVRPSFDPQGNVRGMAYAFKEVQVPGSALGRAYAWPRFSAERQITITAEDLARAVRAMPAAASRGGPAPEVRPDAPAIERLFARLELREATVAFWPLGDPSEQAEVRRGWGPEHLAKASSWIEGRNTGGAAEILFRPADPSRFLVIAGRCPRLARAEREGLGPDAVVRIGGRVEAWYLLPEGLESKQRAALETELSRLLGGRRSRNGFGHLPGYLARDDSLRVSAANLRLPAPRHPEALEVLLEGGRATEPSPTKVRDWVPPVTASGGYRPILDDAEARETLEHLKTTIAHPGREAGGGESPELFQAFRESHDRLAAHLGLREGLPEDLERVAAVLEVPEDLVLRGSLESGARLRGPDAEVPAEARERAERLREGLERLYAAGGERRTETPRDGRYRRAEGRLRRAERAWTGGDPASRQLAERFLRAQVRRDLGVERLVRGDPASYEGLRSRALAGERSEATFERLRELLSGKSPAPRGLPKTLGEAIRERRHALAEILVCLRRGRSVAGVDRERAVGAIDRFRAADRAVWAFARRAVRAPSPALRATGLQSVIEYAGKAALRGVKRRTRQLLLIGPLRQAFQVFQLGQSLATANPLGVATFAVSVAIALGRATAQLLELGDPTRSRGEGRGGR